MAARLTNEPQSRSEAGDALIVIHDFQARSSDELSLSKGDRVELIERDDEFGDGWFLGRHLVSNNTGLFPEVYTRPSPKSPSTFAPSRPLPSVAEPATSSTVKNSKESSSTLPLKTNTSDPSMPPTVGSGSPFLGLGRLSNPSQDSQVLHETLNVINEHITDLRSTTNNGPFGAPIDSGSEYSTSAEKRMSYIQGEETDEEEDLAHTRPEVESWNPEDVAEYLFTAGVEKHHCEVFRDQEISGEVLLGMDQSSLFIKAFDLGSVGRRLKTWQKIKALQDEVSSHSLAVKGMARPRDYEAAPDDVKRTRSRTNTLTSPVMNRSASVQRRRLSSTQTPKASPSTLNSASSSPVAIRDSPTRATHAKRPSAASVRELNHSRQHSSTDFRISGSMPSGLVPALTTAKSSAGVDGPHKKQPSFDRNWTLGSALSQSSPRPSSSAGFHDVAAACDADILQDSAVDLDRGYFSGTEADGRKRNVLRKRDSLDHSRKSSYIEEQRVRSATALSKHSRFGSVDSSRDGALSPAVQKYYGIQAATHRRTASTTAESTRPVPPVKDLPSPTVANIEAAAENDRRRVSPTVAKHPGLHSDWFSAVVHKPMGKGRPGMRAISDKLTSSRLKYGDATDLPPKDSCLVSPARTGSSTPSAGPSLDLESPGTGKSSITTTTPGSKAPKKKGKKETSAYTRGLLNVSPLEAKKDADYYGWMRKKSSNMMTTWKPRLFVLKGRRLAYYYSEEDDREKGLIDISFHRVLPADNEKLTGLHATIAGAVGGPNIPAVNFLAGVSDASTGLVKGDDSIFIFKLMPPRAGLSRAVNFTKPKVHYFAVPNLQQGRLWMAALMKATIDRDDSQPVTSTYQQKTISLAKAKQMRHRPPALMNFEPHEEAENMSRSLKPNGLGILGESDSGVSGMGKLAAVKSEGSPMGADAREKVDSLPLQSP